MDCPAVPALRTMVENEWSVAAQARLTVQSDAAGACDGIKDGLWGFHTDDVANPWWQVDLGAPTVIARVEVWNRCDGAASRAASLKILVSDDGTAWKEVFANGGRTFMGFTDGKPLDARFDKVTGRFVRIQLPGKSYLHLDEVEVFGPDAPGTNLALGKPATQCGLSAWSRVHKVPVSPSDEKSTLAANWAQRAKALANPLLDFDDILFTKRVPGSFNHMSDQYYGWWSRPGGGIFILRNFKSQQPEEVCLTGAFREPGSFLRPMLSWDAKKVLFAWCRHYPALAAERDKMDKKNVPRMRSITSSR
jgi:hypothetical protein